MARCGARAGNGNAESAYNPSGVRHGERPRGNGHHAARSSDARGGNRGTRRTGSFPWWKPPVSAPPPARGAAGAHDREHGVPDDAGPRAPAPGPRGRHARTSWPRRTQRRAGPRLRRAGPRGPPGRAGARPAAVAGSAPGPLPADADESSRNAATAPAVLRTRVRSGPASARGPRPGAGGGSGGCPASRRGRLRRARHRSCHGPGSRCTRPRRPRTTRCGRRWPAALPPPSARRGRGWR